MRNIQHKLFALLFIALAFSNLCFSQDDPSFDLSSEINRVYPYITITKAELKEAESLVDINPHYKPSWVRKYISVEIVTQQKGKATKTVSKDYLLSQEQKDKLNTADTNSDISVIVKYVPENTLKHNDPKEFDFTFKVDPVKGAAYPEGQEKLSQYLKEQTIDKVAEDNFKQYKLTAVRFTINEEGEIVNPHIFESSKDEETDELLLQAIQEMPSWIPAEYSNGTNVKQEFVLMVGDMNSCTANLLKIRKRFE